MDTQLQVFSHQEFGQVRTVNQDGMPWFVAADVCRALEITTEQTRRLEEDEKGLRSIQTPGGSQDMTVVSEPGLYALVLGSRKPEAKAFKRWITHEVLPDIRRHGIYATGQTIETMLSNPETMIRLLTEYKKEKEKSAALEFKALLDAPKVLFADSVAASEQSILIGELAKLMKQNGVCVGQNRLFERLRRDGFLIKFGESRNMPTQYTMENGWMEIKERAIHNPDGSIRLTRTPKVTGKGQQYFINRYLCK